MKVNPKRFNPIILGIVAVLLSAIVVVAFWQLRSGIRVTIENRGPEPLKAVVLHVTGKSYPLGDIPPGSSAKAKVKPTGDSNLKIELVDADGKHQKLDAGAYFEPGYWGEIRISIKNGAIVENDQQVDVGLQ